MTSVFYRPITLSARALSYESPTLPTEGSIPASLNRSLYRIDIGAVRTLAQGLW